MELEMEKKKSYAALSISNPFLRRRLLRESAYTGAHYTSKTHWGHFTTFSSWQFFDFINLFFSFQFAWWREGDREREREKKKLFLYSDTCLYVCMYVCHRLYLLEI